MNETIQNIMTDLRVTRLDAFNGNKYSDITTDVQQVLEKHLEARTQPPASGKLTRADVTRGIDALSRAGWLVKLKMPIEEIVNEMLRYFEYLEGDKK